MRACIRSLQNNMIVAEEKIYESHIGEKFEEAKENVKKVLEKALATS